MLERGQPGVECLCGGSLAVEAVDQVGLQVLSNDGAKVLTSRNLVAPLRMPHDQTGGGERFEVAWWFVVLSAGDSEALTLNCSLIRNRGEGKGTSSGVGA